MKKELFFKLFLLIVPILYHLKTLENQKSPKSGIPFMEKLIILSHLII